MTYRPAAERTRSKRFRSGTRRNKRNPVAHIQLCPMPRICLVHTRDTLPRPTSMAMKLTPCEQRWVDDIRAGLTHIHTSPWSGHRKSWQSNLLLLRQQINTARMAAAGTINESNHVHLHMHDSGISSNTTRMMVTTPQAGFVSALRERAVKAMGQHGRR